MKAKTAIKIRINIGCGVFPTPDWVNFDNSLSVRIAKYKIVVIVLCKLGFLSKESKRFIEICRDKHILYADGTKNIPFPDGSVDVVYSSHMVEHLDKNDISLFLIEVRRVLASKGKIRIAVPNLRYHVDNYIKNKDGDKFIRNLYLTTPNLKTINEKIKFLMFGNRIHKWMYDGKSMVHVLNSIGFNNPQVLMPGETTIQNYGALNLYEREEESVYIEAENP